MEVSVAKKDALALAHFFAEVRRAVDGALEVLYARARGLEFG